MRPGDAPDQVEIAHQVGNIGSHVLIPPPHHPRHRVDDDHVEARAAHGGNKRHPLMRGLDVSGENLGLATVFGANL